MSSIVPESGVSCYLVVKTSGSSHRVSPVINKIGIVEKEAAESEYWLELFDEANIGDPEEHRWLLRESGELLAIFTSIGKTSKSRR